MIEARDLCVRYPRGPLALDGVTVTANPGEVVAVVGPNGSGKSTLLRVIAGLVAPQAGAVNLNGAPLTHLTPHGRVARGIAYAPEHAPVLARLSVLDNLTIGAWLRRDRRLVARDLARVLEWFPALRQHLRRPGESLSASARQMLAFGRALMAAPSVLLLDEPLVGCGTDARAAVASALRALRRDGIAILLTAHDLRAAREMADRAYGLRGGRIVFGGSAAALELTTVLGGLYE